MVNLGKCFNILLFVPKFTIMISFFTLPGVEIAVILHCQNEILTFKNNDKIMNTTKWICPVCGYVHEGENAPEKCPQCKVPGSKFKKMEENAALQFVTEHELGIAGMIPQGPEGDFVRQGLKDHFLGECTEVGMYIAMSRQADREGYPEIAEAFKRYALEEADHAARFAEMLGEVVWDTKTNVEKRMMAEEGACAGKMDIARVAKQLNLDAIHDSVHEMAKDEARHGAGFQGLFNRFFKK